MRGEPWYGVRLIYKLATGELRQAYEERVIIVRAESAEDALGQAERYSKEYEGDTRQYTGYAMLFHIFDEDGPCLGPGVEVFSLVRYSDLDVDDYLDRFHDTGNECTRSFDDE
jgi:hypothetical protein